MKTKNLKSFTAVKFRLVLITLMTLVVALMLCLFFFGYQFMQSVSNETAKRQADAAASEDSIGNLQRLQAQLKKLEGLDTKLAALRSSDSLPQFETENSLRTIAQHLGLTIKAVEFIEASPAPGGGQANSGSGAAPAPTPVRSSKISFEFSRPLTYTELIRFLDAIETSTPKLSLEGIALPSGSTRNSIDLGTLTLEMATN